MCMKGHVSAEELKSLERYKRLTQSKHFGFWEWSPATDRLIFSGAFWQCLGYEHGVYNELYAVDITSRFVHPKDLRSLSKNKARFLKHQDFFKQRIRMLCADGTYLPVYLDGTGAQVDGQLILTGMGFDQSSQLEIERRLQDSEERHARILSASNDGLWEWERDSNDIHFSSRCWQMLGYEGEDDIFSSSNHRLRQWRKLIHTEDLDHFNQSLALHRAGEKPFDVEYRIKAKSDHWHWIRARGQAVFDEQGMPYRMSGTNMDITDLKESEETVLRAKEQAEQANQAKSQFLSSMSHELRTPLNAILGFAQITQQEARLEQDHRQNVIEIISAGKHLLQLINEVLDLSKIESGQVKLSVEPVLLSRVLDEAVTLIQPQLEEKSVALTVDLGLLEETYVNADSLRLRQTIINLVGNAVKYNVHHGRVTVKLSQHQQTCRIDVEDTGIGIAKELHSEMFQPFNRLAAEGSTIEGTGVGLVITKQLVEAMGGVLGFDSEKDVGSRFWIELPVIESGESLDPALEKQVEQAVIAVDEPLFSDTKNVLYIEDNPSNIRLMEQVFKRFSTLELTIATEPFAGIYTARTQCPDLILSDINLPGIDGYQILEVLKGDPVTCAIPVIALSANAMAHDIERGLQAGFDGYLTKPLDIGEMLLQFNCHLNQGG